MWLGPLAIAIVWAMFSFVYFASDRRGHTTLSSVAASRKRNYWLFCSTLLVSGLLIFLFMKDWLIPTLELPSITMYLTFAAALVFQPVIAIVPLGNKWQSFVHNVAAYAECILMPPIAVFIAQSYVLPWWVRMMCWGLIVFMIYLAAEFRRYFLKPKFIHIQAYFTASFHLIILIAFVAGANIK